MDHPDSSVETRIETPIGLVVLEKGGRCCHCGRASHLLKRLVDELRMEEEQTLLEEAASELLFDNGLALAMWLAFASLPRQNPNNDIIIIAVIQLWSRTVFRQTKPNLKDVEGFVRKLETS